MKFNKFIYATMAAALLAACSDKDVVADGPDTGTITVPEGGDGFVAVRINLPTTPVATAPRAANDDLNDGTANEYKVTDAALLLFNGASEEAATFASAYTLSIPRWFDDVADDDHITTSALVAVEVTNPASTGQKIYGLVMLNYKNVATIDGTTLKFGTEAFSGTFKDFAAKTSTADFYNVSSANSANYFFMTNAPLSSVDDAQDPTGKVTTLVDITNGIKPTKAEAEQAPAGEFFVERAVAKATLSVAANATDMEGATIVKPDGTKITLTHGDVEWTLNGTNTQSFVVRNMYKADDQPNDFLGCKSGYTGRTYRMVGNSNLASNLPIQGPANPERYRTYWCYDPNYDTQTVPLTFKDNTAAGFVKAVNTNPLYCYENTFDIDNQVHAYTTQAIVKVQYEINGTAKTFYTLDGQQNIIYLENDVKSYFVASILRNDDFKAAIATAVEGTSETVNITTSNYKTYLDIEWNTTDKGIVEIKNLDFKSAPFEALNEGKGDSDTKVKVPVMPAALKETVNGEYTFAEYKDGVSYYAIRFKHFAGADINDEADLAPWDPTKVGTTTYDVASYKDKTVTSGKTASDMWLGRYGMVRNNWYDVNVTAFKKLGSPTIADLDITGSKTDDEVEQWIAVKISLLSWAMRKQNIEL